MSSDHKKSAEEQMLQLRQNAYLQVAAVREKIRTLRAQVLEEMHRDADAIFHQKMAENDALLRNQEETVRRQMDHMVRPLPGATTGEDDSGRLSPGQNAIWQVTASVDDALKSARRSVADAERTLTGINKDIIPASWGASEK